MEGDGGMHDAIAGVGRLAGASSSSSSSTMRRGRALDVVIVSADGSGAASTGRGFRAKKALVGD